MARKKKADGEKLVKPVAFRLTADDYRQYEKKYLASGLSKSEFFRDCVLKNKTQVVAKEKASGDKKRLLYLVNKAGNNINQLAHRANSDHLAGVLDRGHYGQILEELQLLTRYLNATLRHVD